MFKAQYDLNLEPAERLKAAGLRKAIRIGANRAAAKVKAAYVSHAQALGGKGNIAKSLRIRVKVYPGDKYVAIVGPSRAFTRSGGTAKRGKNKGKKRRIIPASYAHLVDKGTKRSKARRFVEQTFNETKEQYLADAAHETGVEIQKELQRRRGP